ncbi:ubiquitin-protein ligase E3C [Trichonephila clavipes]|nr:ubiquitin-protein ligase E3C [Trichonephila clavipes]
MYSFEGEFRRRPQQSLGGASRKVAREELLHKAQRERLQREERRRIIQSATIIQAFVRGALARQVEKRKIRDEFDQVMTTNLKNQTSFSSNPDVLYNEIGKFLHFYNEQLDSSRLIAINQLFLRDAAFISELFASRLDSWLYKMQKLLWFNLKYLKNCVKPNANISLSLRFIEVFSALEFYDRLRQYQLIKNCSENNLSPNHASKILEKVWEYLIRKGYYAALRLVLDNNVPDSLLVSPHPPTPLASTLLDLFTRPIVLKSEKKPYFFQTLLQDCFTEELSQQIICFLLPALSCKSDIITIDTILTAIYPDNLAFNFQATLSLLYTFMYLISKQAKSLSDQQCAEYLICVQFLLQSIPTWRVSTSSECESEDGEMMVENDNKLQIQEEIINMVNEIDHVNMIFSILDNEKVFNQCAVSISSLCYLLLDHQKLALHHYRLLYSLAFKPSFFRLLWRSIVSANVPSALGNKTPVLQLLNQGMFISPNDQEVFLPQLISFCALLNHLLSTLHDFEFYDQSNDKNSMKMMPFTLVELATISTTLKDVCMGLIELAYPDKKSTFNKDYVSAMESVGAKSVGKTISFNLQQWNLLFKVVVALLRQLYSRDCRRKFCPEGAWIARQFPIFFDRAAEMYFPSRRNYGYEPFVGLQNMTREQLESEGPPLSAVEARQLAILHEFPFAIQFHDRFKILMSLIVKDKQENQGELSNFQMGSLIRITVRRNFIYEDASTYLSLQSEPNIKMRILVQLVNAVGLDEVGIDGGGLFREFLQELLKTCFDPNRGFFKTTNDGLLYPNPNVQRVMPDFSRHYFFIGRMVGKAMYENMLVELPLAAFFLTKILSRHSTSDVDIHHLASLDPVMYRNLLFLKTYDGNVADLGLDFTVMNSEFGENEVVELIPGGANIPVTESNRINYIHLMADFKLNKQIKAQCQAFKEGLANVIDMDWLYMFDANELQILISGAQTPIDIEDLKVHTVYAGGYHRNHHVIRAFWRVVEGFQEQQKRQLLKFVTSCSHAPLFGFKELSPTFCIQNAGRELRLPTASTCMNLLKLPEFDNEEVLKLKLSYAIESGAGFELS